MSSSQSSSKTSFLGLLTTIAWPLALGTAIAAVFLTLVKKGGPLENPIFVRYFAGHPICMVETAFFFAGCVALVIKALEIWGEYGQVDKATLGEKGPLLQPEEATHLLDRWQELPTATQNSWLGRRLQDVLAGIKRTGTADKLEDEMKYLAEGDILKQQDSYSLLRIIVWATPMLGFLGTVVGITEALGGLDPKQLATAPDVAFQGLKNGLYTAFDTTAIALAFSMFLMFVQYFLDKVEGNLLTIVDGRAAEELTGRFAKEGTSTDPHVRTIERMSVAVIRATEALVEKQAEMWQHSLEHAQNRWQTTANTAGDALTNSLSTALSGTLGKHVDQLAAVEHKAGEQMQRRWEQWQTALSDNARLLHSHQQELVRQSEMMTQALHAVADVTKLETALNSNLQSLAGAKNFEDTVLSLSAAINLLNSRLGKPDAERVELTKTQKGKAA